MDESVATVAAPEAALDPLDQAPQFDQLDRFQGGRPADETWQKRDLIPFAIFHILPFAALFTGVPLKAWMVCIALYWVRIFFITAGYHRYFSHRTYSTNRVFQFILAFGGGTACQKGALWWASHHRLHHRYSDTQDDIHSPIKGFWWSHIGWITSTKSKPTHEENITDFAKYPELRFLNRHDIIPPWVLGAACFFYAGLPGLFIGFFLSTVFVWHGTFLVNSAAHLMGRRRYATTDTSRNSAIIAFLTCGEGWHNNHHYYPASVKQGFFWWEFDLSYYVLRMLSWVGVVSDLKVPTPRALNSCRLDEGAFDVGMFRQHWRRAARAVTDSRARAALALEASRNHAAQTVDSRLEALSTQASRARSGLEGMVDATFEGADELARLTRRLRPAPVDNAP